MHLSHMHSYMFRSRYRFMIEMLEDLKSNKKKLVKGESDLVTRWKKSLAGMLSRKATSKMEPLRIRLIDLCSESDKSSGETHRKWLLAGYARGKLVDEEPSRQDDVSKRRKRGGKEGAESSDSVLYKAEEQHMNTDIRKLIFTVLMTSEDYLDAMERLGKLKLNAKQSREIARVIMHCCGQEKTYNPYYGLVANALVVSDKEFSRTFMYCLWDTFKEVTTDSSSPALDVRRLSNLAKFFAFLIAQNALNFCALKAAAFEKLDTVPSLQLFLTLLISRSLLQVKKEKYLTEAFGKIRKMKEYTTLKEGLIFFFGKSKSRFSMLDLDTDMRLLLQSRATLVMSVLRKVDNSDVADDAHHDQDLSESSETDDQFD